MDLDPDERYEIEGFEVSIAWDGRVIAV